MMFKNIFYTILLGTFLFVMDRMQPVMSEQSISDMQGCQALIGFVDHKLEQTAWRENNGDLTTIREGLQAYNSYIQSEIITPNLLDYTDGVAAEAQAIQVQIDVYKKSLFAVYESKYPQKQIVMDFVTSLQGCENKASPTGLDLQLLQAAINTLTQIAIKA